MECTILCTMNLGMVDVDWVKELQSSQVEFAGKFVYNRKEYWTLLANELSNKLE